MANLSGKTLFITGASRGIGKAIALRAARDGANVVIAAKTANPNPKLPGTIHTSAEEINQAGGKALPLVVDVRDENRIASAVEEAVARFGGIDILVNNASAISLTGTLHTPMKRYDLMMQVNVRATYAASQACIPHLQRATNPHILNLSPPINLDPRWFRDHVAYTMSKYGMTMCAMGMAEEFRSSRIAVNALWPRTAIATAAIRNLLGGEEAIARCRTPDIVADAAHAILVRDSRTCTGNTFIDEDVLREEGVTDFSRYGEGSDGEFLPDFFLD